MKQTFLFTVAITILFNVLTSVSFAQDRENISDSTKSGNMVVIVSDIESDKGSIMLALYDSKENYQTGKASFSQKININNGKAQHVFAMIPYGEYAIKYYHDENLNGRLDTNLFGIPKEGYGFSNNASGNFGPADFEDARFIFNTSKQNVELSIQ
ncbi:MAG: DUF2141 domain-containing protein [Ignavibacteriales bacterium]|nr:DUF2141 domain-containing protein [Ignavibacteriales bacterium]MCF8432703.1 DUF2141 domain-containing protein [Melioribacteraceae bacterium]